MVITTYLDEEITTYLVITTYLDIYYIYGSNRRPTRPFEIRRDYLQDLGKG